MPTASPTLSDPQPNPAWATLPLFDRSGWKRVRFGDVVRQLKEQVNPEADGIERYVAEEHMDTENVHICKWGTVGDGYLGPAFIRGFRKGQVLYGSRRTYLKKVAVAEWDGVTANTTFVLETVEGKMLQELLPWLMLSERFTKHSVQESKGSTNPYINFPDIAKFEFDLPPLDQQRRIAEILWAVDEAQSANEALTNAVKKVIETSAKNFVFPFGYTATARELDCRYSSSYVTRKAAELYDVASGNGEPSASEGGGVLFFKVNDFNLNSDELFLENGGTLFDPEANSKIRIFPPRTVVFPKRGASIFLNKVGVTRRPVALDPNLMGLVPRESVIRSEYLYWLIKLTDIGRIADTTSLPQLNHKHLLPLIFPVPNLEIQEDLLARVQTLRTAESVCRDQCANLRSLNQSFLNAIFTP